MTGPDKTYFWWMLLAFALGAGSVVLEIAAEGIDVSIQAFLIETLETSLILIGAGGVFILLKRTNQQHQEQVRLIQELSLARKEGSEWRHRAQVHVTGLSQEIERQFERWDLTIAEKEVGIMLLKGLTHKDIAALRGTAETTVRQQARAIYQKSGLQGKSGFSAYFLEDLLPAAHLKDSNRISY
jgi:DNA-binding CsgD family transcriptional regulator